MRRSSSSKGLSDAVSSLANQRAVIDRLYLLRKIEQGIAQAEAGGLA